MDKHFFSRWQPSATDEAEAEREWLEKRRSLLTASDVSAALGDNPWKSEVELWEEKTGLRAPEDLSHNEAVIYGKENEARIRQSFADENESWCKVEYHARDILVSKRATYLGATLDGELEVESDDNPYGLMEGDSGVLEIKTGSFRSAEGLAAWNRVPLYYVEQVTQQIFCSGATFGILRAELRYTGSEEYRGSLPEVATKDFFFRFNPAAEEELLIGARAFWNHVVNKTMPEVKMKADTGMQIAGLDLPEVEDVELSADVVIGRFNDNFDEIEKDIEAMVEPYRGLVFTPDQTKEAKKLRAELNKKKSTANDLRRALEDKYNEPLTAFKNRVKHLVGIIDDVAKPIDAQIKAQEEQERLDREHMVSELYLKTIGEELADNDRRMFYRDNGFDMMDPKWMLKSTSQKAITTAMKERLAAYSRDCDDIERHASGDGTIHSVMLMAYGRERNIAAAFRAEDDYRATQKRLEEQKREEAERRAQVQQPQQQPQAEPRKESPEDGKTKAEQNAITFTFRASHSSKREWAALLRYMLDHGFEYEKLN